MTFWQFIRFFYLCMCAFCLGSVIAYMLQGRVFWGLGFAMLGAWNQVNYMELRGR